MGVGLSLSEDSVNIAENYSIVRARAYYYGNGLSWSNYYCPVTINVDGQVWNGSSTFGKNGTKLIGETTFKIYHNADGTRRVSGSVSFATGVSIGTLTANATIDLTNIPRKSTLKSVSPSTVEFGSPTTISINRAVSSFTHTLQIYYDGAWHDIATGVGDSYVWTPKKELASYFTTNPLNVNLRIHTYTGSTNLGYNDYSNSLTLSPTEGMAPSISITATDSNGYLQTYGGFVQKKSIINVRINETISYGSPIVSRNIMIGNEYFSESPATASTPIPNLEIGITASVVDGRGMSAESSLNPTVLSYADPMIEQVSAFRCSSDGTRNDDGTYANISYSIKVAPLNNINSHSAKIMYKKTSDETWATKNISMSNHTISGSTIIGNGGLSNASTYQAKIVVTDDFKTVTSQIITISTSFRFINFRNEGIGIGKINEKNRSVDILDGFEVFTGKTRTSLTNAEIDILKGLLNADQDSLYSILYKLVKKDDTLTFTNKTIDLTKAVSDATYSDYPYHVDLALPGCLESFVPNVYLGSASSVISSICESFNGYLRFYVSDNTGEISIPSILLVK